MMASITDRIAEWEIPEPHFRKPDEDCMGNPTPGYWRVFAHGPKERFLILAKELGVYDGPTIGPVTAVQEEFQQWLDANPDRSLDWEDKEEYYDGRRR